MKKMVFIVLIILFLHSLLMSQGLVDDFVEEEILKEEIEPKIVEDRYGKRITSASNSNYYYWVKGVWSLEQSIYEMRLNFKCDDNNKDCGSISFLLNYSGKYYTYKDPDYGDIVKEEQSDSKGYSLIKNSVDTSNFKLKIKNDNKETLSKLINNYALGYVNIINNESNNYTKSDYSDYSDAEPEWVTTICTIIFSTLTVGFVSPAVPIMAISAPDYNSSPDAQKKMEYGAYLLAGGVISFVAFLPCLICMMIYNKDYFKSKIRIYTLNDFYDDLNEFNKKFLIKKINNILDVKFDIEIK